MHVMIDIETMGVRHNAAVVAIGAVKFDPRGEPGQLGDAADPEYRDFYANVDLQSSLDAGLRVDGGTVMWWLKQSGQARDRLQDVSAPPASLQAALSELTIWFGPERLPTWGNGAAFDLVILRNAYLAHGANPPWRYTDERCYRTLRAELPEVAYLPPVLAHDALEDARAQAVHLQKLYQIHLTKRG
jgi:hypothetical protein